MASRRGVPTTVISAAPATTRCSYSTSLAIWSGVRYGQATCTRRTAGVRYWNQSCRVTGARGRGYIFEATRPSPTRRFTNSSKSKAWATRSGCQSIGSCRIRLDTCSSARSVDRRMRCAVTMPASAIRRRAGDGAGRSRKSEECRLDKFLIRSVNYLTLLGRFLNDAAERGRMGRPSGKCRVKRQSLHQREERPR